MAHKKTDVCRTCTPFQFPFFQFSMARSFLYAIGRQRELLKSISSWRDRKFAYAGCTTFLESYYCVPLQSNRSPNSLHFVNNWECLPLYFNGFARRWNCVSTKTGNADTKQTNHILKYHRKRVMIYEFVYRRKRRIDWPVDGDHGDG